MVETDGFELLETAALDGDCRTAAMRAALRGLDRGRGRGSDSAVQHTGCHSTGSAKSHEFSRRLADDAVTDSQEMGGGALVTDSQTMRTAGR